MMTIMSVGYSADERKAFDELVQATGKILVHIGALVKTLPPCPVTIDAGGSRGDGPGANAIIETIRVLVEYEEVLLNILRIEQHNSNALPAPETGTLMKKSVP